jgi:ABC-type phosphate/phosphonate transport system substrate-binding protein
MRRLLPLLALTLLPGVSARAQSATPFRVVIADAGLTGCAATGAAEAYRRHLEQRLSRPVSLCGAADTKAAAAELRAGKADMVVLDPAAFETVKDVARAALAGRVNALTGRVLSLALVLKTSGKTSLAALTGATPIFAGNAPASMEVPLRAIGEAGAPIDSFKPAMVFEGDEPAFAALRAGRGDVLVINASARARACMTPDIKRDPCADLAELWRGRPRAARALVVRNTMPTGDRHQLVGIHIGLHFEAPTAMRFMAQALPPAVALDPAEAGALLLDRR